MKRCLLALFIAVAPARLGSVAFAADDGQGADADLDRLAAYAKAQREDLVSDLMHASGKDKAALARVFRFSLKFTELDANAKTYGRILYDSFLGEAYSTKQYARMIAAQPEAVRQRIRDFLHYEMIHDDPDTVNEQNEKQSPDWLLLFPKNYSFGAGDLIFKREASLPPARSAP
jgi:hypothetical protein